MNKQFSLILFFIMTMFGCGTYNTPFINADETMQLNLGMSKNDVITSLGEPLFVDSGGNGKITYVYEVRTILVKSNPANGEPNKFDLDQKHAKPIHRLKLVFQNNKLVHWGPSDEGK
jgi:outer membrane protein assembly factor BamE (lipoprotein component of BamABCDE complex)